MTSLTSRIYLRSFLCFLLCLLFGSLIWSADSPKVSVEPRAKPVAPTANSPRADIRVDTNVVLIPVTVTDPLNRFVTGLEKEHFKLFEDKVEQQIAYFASEDAPLSIGLVFDTSGSMGNKLGKSRQAVSEFFKTANPEDEFFLVQFNDQPQLVHDFTTRFEEIQSGLIFTQAKLAVGSGTSLDIRRAEVALGQAQVQRLTARNNVEVEKLRLFQQLGVAQPADVTFTTDFPVNPPTFSLDSLLDLARRQNPAVLALRSRERAAALNVKVAQAAYTPTLNLSTGWGGNSYQYTDADYLAR